jgi:hypothetical protein
MAKGLRYVVEAYILFDQDGSGSIDRKEVMALIAERSDKEGKNGLLSADRWKELDWDSDGSITFKVRGCGGAGANVHCACCCCCCTRIHSPAEFAELGTTWRNNTRCCRAVLLFYFPGVCGSHVRVGGRW